MNIEPQQKIEPYARSKDYSSSLAVGMGLTNIGNEEDAYVDASRANAGLTPDDLYGFSMPAVREFEIRCRMLGGTEKVQNLLLGKGILERKIARLSQIQKKKEGDFSMETVKVGEGNLEEMLTLSQINRVLGDIDREYFEAFLFVREMVIHEPKRMAATTTNMRDVSHTLTRLSMGAQSTITIAPKRGDFVEEKGLGETIDYSSAGKEQLQKSEKYQ